MIIVAGENVADLIPAPASVPASDSAVEPALLRLTLGGGPANTAVAAARLGAEVSFAARFGSDAPGRAFRARLTEAGVDLRHAVDVPNPSSLALVSIDATGAAAYDFWLAGAADFTATALPPVRAGDIQHIGSLAAYWPPGADVIEEWVSRRSPATVTLDVNLRPIVLATQPDVVERLGRLVRNADVVKASDEDLRLAYPGADPEETARGWLEAGPSIIVITLGARGALGLTRNGCRVLVPAPVVEVADTIGAGDAAMGALLTRLAANGADGIGEDLEETLRFIVATAALACTKPGAYAPYPAEVSSMAVSDRFQSLPADSPAEKPVLAAHRLP
jgi:fructokinase